MNLSRAMKLEKEERLFEAKVRKATPKQEREITPYEIVVPLKESKMMVLDQAIRRAAKFTDANLVETAFLYDVDALHPITPIISGGMLSVDTEPLKKVIRKHGSAGHKTGKIGDFHVHPEDTEEGFSSLDMAVPLFRKNTKIAELTVAWIKNSTIIINTMLSPSMLPRREQKIIKSELIAIIDEEDKIPPLIRQLYGLQKTDPLFKQTLIKHNMIKKAIHARERVLWLKMGIKRRRLTI